MRSHRYDVVVVGAGVFGAWAGLLLRRMGLSVLIADAWGPGNGRSSSGGETRITRVSYGSEGIYSEWAARSLAGWRDLARQTGERLYVETGVLWMARESDALSLRTLATLRELGLPHERLDRADLERRFAQIDFGPVSWAIHEPSSGVLLARRAVAAAVRQATTEGAEFAVAAADPPRGRGRVGSIATTAGPVSAGAFVFAAGPWLGKLFPELLGDRIFPTRQEVFYFGAPPGDPRFAPPSMPAWIDFGSEIYGIPDIESRGFKIAPDRHGERFDPDRGERVVTAESLALARRYLAERFPALRDAPLIGSEVCQYENTSNGDFLIDRHPDLDDVWLLGGGSGHGFKHGPAVGACVAAWVANGVAADPRFGLATKAAVQRRAVY